MASSPSSSTSSCSAASSAPEFSSLPIMSLRTKIVDKILQNRVTLIVGETGCGMLFYSTSLLIALIVWDKLWLIFTWMLFVFGLVKHERLYVYAWFLMLCFGLFILVICYSYTCHSCIWYFDFGGEIAWLVSAISNDSRHFQLRWIYSTWY